jgi:hypothetical protein
VVLADVIDWLRRCSRRICGVEDPGPENDKPLVRDMDGRADLAIARLKAASRVTSTCAVNMTGDRSVVIGVGCMTVCVGYLDLAGHETSGQKPPSTDRSAQALKPRLKP